MADYGLIGGIGQGLQQGLLAYQRTKQLNRENQIQNLTSGVEQDDNGNLKLNDQQQQLRQAQGLKSKADIDSYDPNSQKSINTRNLARQVMSKSLPGSEKAITEDMSAAELNAENGLVGKAVSGGLGMQGSQIKASAMMGAAAGKNQSFADRDAVQVSKDYETTLKPYRQVGEDVNKIEGTLNTKDKNGKPLITAQQMGDVNAAIARIYSPNHMSDATVNRTEYESAPSTFAKALQKWTANPEDIGSRQLIDHILDQAHHLANVSNENAERERQSLDSGYTNLQVPSAKKTAQDKSADFHKRFSVKYPERGDAQGLLGQSNGNAHPQDQAAIAWAQANPNDPRSAAILKANGVQ